MSNISKNQDSTFSLILGIFFIFFGIYRVYKYFLNEVSTFRAILGIGWFYNLRYIYFIQVQKIKTTIIITC